MHVVLLNMEVVTTSYQLKWIGYYLAPFLL